MLFSQLSFFAFFLVCFVATFGWVVLCFTIFRSQSLAIALRFLEQLASFAPSEAVRLGWRFALFYAALGAAHLLIYRSRERLQRRAREISGAGFSVAYGASCWFVVFFTPTNASPFIYFQF